MLIQTLWLWEWCLQVQPQLHDTCVQISHTHKHWTRGAKRVEELSDQRQGRCLCMYMFLPFLWVAPVSCKP